MASSPGTSRGAVANASEQHLAAEATVFVDLEHVDGDVGGGEALNPIEGVLPGFGGLAGESGDEVDVDGFDDAGRT